MSLSDLGFLGGFYDCKHVMGIEEAKSGFAGSEEAKSWSPAESREAIGCVSISRSYVFLPGSLL